MSATDRALPEDIRTYAKRLAKECIYDWAHEGRHERNDEWGTDFTDDELDQIVTLAQSAVVTLPETL